MILYIYIYILVSWLIGEDFYYIYVAKKIEMYTGIDGREIADKN